MADMIEDVKLFQIKGALILGIDARISSEQTCLQSPRILQMVADAKGNIAGFRIMNFIGSPTEIIIHEYEFCYVLTDEEMIRKYRESVSGLSLPKIDLPSNVTKFPGENHG